MAGIESEFMKPQTKNVMNKRKQSGFTLLEAMISILVLSFGVLSLAAIYAQGAYYAAVAQYDYIAEKKAEQAVEAMFTARDIKSLNWTNLQNVSQGGVFVDGASKILVPGPDGLVGTISDLGAADEVVITGTTTTIDLNPFMTRTIAISPVLVAGGNAEPNLRQITVTINYQIGNQKRNYTLISYISSFA
jgi:type II secretory pathway pseudopilin PulG